VLSGEPKHKAAPREYVQEVIEFALSGICERHAGAPIHRCLASGRHDPGLRYTPCLDELLSRLATGRFDRALRVPLMYSGYGTIAVRGQARSYDL
jgi:hypothetical protein